jgi:hypothetical protein
MWHACERRQKCKRFWWESPKEIDHSEDQGVDGRMGSEWILVRLAGGVWIVFDWLRIETHRTNSVPRRGHSLRTL